MHRVNTLGECLQWWKLLLKDLTIKIMLAKCHLLFQEDLHHHWCSLRIPNTITKYNSLEESPKREGKAKTEWSSQLISTISSDMRTKIWIFSKIHFLMRVFMKMYRFQIYLSGEAIHLYLKVKISRIYCSQHLKIS